ncbi:MAG: hypothetical protein ABW321_02780 [Polyangiales bacterium]
MFGKLKDLAGASALEKALTTAEPVVAEHLAKVQALGAEVVGDDGKFASQVISPAYLAIVAASQGAAKLVPQLEERFSRIMFSLRDELVVIEGTTARLVDDFRAQLPAALSKSIKA